MIASLQELLLATSDGGNFKALSPIPGQPSSLRSFSVSRVYFCHPHVTHDNVYYFLHPRAVIQSRQPDTLWHEHHLLILDADASAPLAIILRDEAVGRRSLTEPL